MMRGSSQTKTVALSSELLQALERFRNRWQALRRATEPAERAAAEDGVRAAYRAAGCLPPTEIVWGRSPIEIARDHRQMRRRVDIGRNLRIRLIDNVRAAVDCAVATALDQATYDRVTGCGRVNLSRGLSASVLEAVRRGLDDVGPSLIEQVRSATAGFYNGKAWLNGLSTFRGAGLSQHEFGWLCGYQFLHDACGLRSATGMLGGLWSIASHAGWFVPYERICWLSDRHNILRSDDRDRLHCGDGPALAYPDGWSAYAWKGIALPSAYLTDPESISLASIHNQHDRRLRRCMIEILTPERFVEIGGARCVSRDETGRLWQKAWPDGDVWAAVEVVNGTPGPDGRRTRYFLQVPPQRYTARSAVAWTYGLLDQQYASLIKRT